MIYITIMRFIVITITIIIKIIVIVVAVVIIIIIIPHTEPEIEVCAGWLIIIECGGGTTEIVCTTTVQV